MHVKYLRNVKEARIEEITQKGAKNEEIRSHDPTMSTIIPR
jgi:hypothetical protein